MENVRVGVLVLPHGEGLALPGYATDGAAGLDLRAAVAGTVELLPGRREAIPTGIQLEIPPGYEGQVRARSGLAIRHGVGLPNAPGTIDSDYRGEVLVLLVNWGEEPFAIRRGDRIAQLVIAPVARAELVPRAELGNTARDGGGFGHTGQR
ncbi:MAG: dUTP diphosphatase [Acidobacteria bacterium]|nr:dUTP diphosphatase [Acidobacteriota bacterium]